MNNENVDGGVEMVCPFTVMLLRDFAGLNQSKLYTVTSVFPEKNIIMANLLEAPMPVEFDAESFQWIKVYNPN